VELNAWRAKWSRERKRKKVFQERARTADESGEGGGGGEDGWVSHGAFVCSTLCRFFRDWGGRGEERGRREDTEFVDGSATGFANGTYALRSYIVSAIGASAAIEIRIPVYVPI